MQFKGMQVPIYAVPNRPQFVAFSWMARPTEVLDPLAPLAGPVQALYTFSLLRPRGGLLALPPAQLGRER